MIPLPFVDPRRGNGSYRLNLKSLRHLLPGASSGLDTICRGILGEAPFLLQDTTPERSSELVNS